MEWLVNLDQGLFLFLNTTCANPVTDLIMPVVTSDTLLRILFAAIVVLLLIWGDTKARWTCLAVIVTVALTDQAVSSFLKPLISRPRPCHTLENINLLVNCGAGMSMPSAHAANLFGQAALFSALYRKVRCPVFTFAALVALSRVFVGVHYPADIIVGGIIGIILGTIVAVVFKKYSTKLPGIKK